MQNAVIHLEQYMTMVQWQLAIGNSKLIAPAKESQKTHNTLPCAKKVPKTVRIFRILFYKHLCKSFLLFWSMLSLNYICNRLKCSCLFSTVGGNVRVIRGCAFVEYNQEYNLSWNITSFHGAEESIKDNCHTTVNNTYVCTCGQHNCNGAKITQVSALLIAVLPLITFGIFHQ